MQLLLRNPALRILTQLWWLPVLIALLVGLQRESPSLGWIGIAGYLGLLLGLMGSGWALVNRSVARERARHRRSEHAFLCPACLHRDEFRYACNSCGQEVDPRAALGGELLGCRCPHCGAKWSESGADRLHAYCGQCRATGDAGQLHERKVVVHGAVTAHDFLELAARGEAETRTVAGVRCFAREREGLVEWNLCLEDLTREQDVLPRSHAVHGLTSVWISEGDPLRLGQIIDHLVSRAELSEDRLAAIRVRVAAAELDPAAQRLLSSRFGEVEYRVPAEAFLGPDSIADPRRSRGSEDPGTVEVAAAEAPRVGQGGAV